MVVAGEDHVVLKGLQAVVQGRDALQIQMVGRLIQYEEIGPRKHHPAQHAPHLLAAGENLCRLVYVVAGEEHSSEESPQIALALVLGELTHPFDQILVEAVEEGVMIFREIGRLDAGAPFDAAAVRLLQTHQNLKQHGHGKFVPADDGDLVFLAHDEADLVQQLHPVDGLGDLCHKQAVLARLAVRLEPDPGIAAAGGGKLFDGDLVQKLAPAGGLARLAPVGREARDKGLQLLDLLLGPLVLVPDQLLNQLARLVPEVVVAHIHLDLAVVDIHDVGADVVEEVAVVAHHQHRPLIVHQKVLQPDHALQVQVVGRLVQQDNVRVPEERLGQQNLDLQAGVNVAHQLAVQFHRHSQALQDPSGVALGFPAAQLGKLLLQLGGADAVLVGEVLLLIDGVLFLSAVIEALIAHDDRVQHDAVVVQALVLLQDGHALFGRQNHRPARRLQFPGENLDKGGFSGAVGADDAVAVSGGELKVHPAEQHRRAKLHTEVIYGKHRLSPP